MAVAPARTVEEQAKFEQLVKEEIPIQRASVALEGGIPKCLTLFDNFLLCYSLRSQINAIYRYGEPRACTRKYEDWKFCMSIKSVEEDAKNELWIKRRAEWWAGRRMGKSSEDVWEAKKDVYLDNHPDSSAQEET